MRRVVAVGPTLVACAFVLGGCATVPEPAPDESLAMQVARAGGFAQGLRDLTPEEFARIRPAVWRDGGSGMGDAADIAWAASNYARPAAGFSPGAGLAIGLLSLFETAGKPSEYSHVAAWLPVEQARDETEAVERLREALETAVMETAPAGYRLERVLMQHDPPFGPPSTERRCFLRGGVCDGPPGPCRMGIRVPKRVKRVQAPVFTGMQGEAWTFKAGNGGFAFHYKGVRPKAVDMRRWHLAVSERLPEWMVLYLPPGNDLFGLPVVLHRGRVVHFVRQQGGGLS
jgi:hypothetical protein